jgi:hypothetical protein
MFCMNIDIPLVRSIMSTKLASRSDLVGNQSYYLISLINTEKRNSRDDKNGLPLLNVLMLQGQLYLYV